MNNLFVDLRRALRTLRKNLGFSVSVLATLGLGIGATTAVFTVLDRVVLRPLPYSEPEQLAYVDSRVPSEGHAAWGVSEAGYFYLRDHNRTFEELGVYGAPGMDYGSTVIGPKGGSRVSSVWVRASLFRVLRARPAIGRLIQEGDDRPGLPTVAVLGHAFWLREYGGDPNVIGQTLDLDGGRSVEVIGVLEPGFNLPERKVDLWVPLGLNPSRPPDRFHGYKVIGRLKSGVSLDDAGRDLARLTAQFPTVLPQAYSYTFMRESGFTTRVTPLRTHVLGRAAGVLWILLGSVALVLLIACANAANLFLVHAEAKRRDRAIRAALGAGRLELVREALSESVLLTLAAGAIGVWLASGAIRLVLTIAPSNLPRLDEVRISGRSIVVAVGVALVAGMVVGCLPLLSSAADRTLLRGEGTAMTPSRRRHLIRGAVVVSQIALAVMLLAAAGLMLRSFERLRSVQPGLDPGSVLTVDVFLPQTHDRYQQRQSVQQFYQALLERVRHLPQVKDAGAGDVPLKDEPTCFATYVEGTQLVPGQQAPCIDMNTVTPGFFRTLGIPLEGREPDWARLEGTGAGREVVVTRALADRLWPGEDPIGKGVRQPDPGPPYARVVGIVDNLRSAGLDRPPVEAIFGQVVWDRGLTLVLKTRVESSEEIANVVRKAISDLEPLAAIGAIRTMEDIVATSPSMARTSFTMVLLGIAAVMGLLLSAVGLFGVLAYVVGQGQAEIGIRMALGAQAHEVATMIVRHSLKLAAAGVALGLAGALLTTQLLRPVLFQVTPLDPLTLGAVALLLVIVVLIASWPPAHRAATVDPMRALRSQ